MDDKLLLNMSTNMLRHRFGKCKINIFRSYHVLYVYMGLHSDTIVYLKKLHFDFPTQQCVPICLFCVHCVPKNWTNFDHT